MKIPFQVIVAALESMQQVRIFWLSWTLGIPQWSLATHTGVDVWLSPPYWSRRCAVSMRTCLEEAGVHSFLTAEPVLVYSSSAREIQARDLPGFKVQLGPKHSTQTLPWFTGLSYCAAGCREGTATHQLYQLLCVQQCLCSAVCLCLSQICSSVVNGILFFFLRKSSSLPKLKSYLNSCRQLSMCHLHTLAPLLIQSDARSNKPLVFLFQITPAKIIIIQNTVFLPKFIQVYKSIYHHTK